MSNGKFVEARVAATRVVARGLTEIVLARPSRRFSYRAGQWLSFRVADGNGVDDKDIWRVYSFASSPAESTATNDGRFSILVDVDRDGPGVAFFAAARPGTKVVFHGPYGEFGLQSEARSAFFVADGAGIGPIRAMVLEHLAGAGHASLHHVADTRDRIAYRDEFARLAAGSENLGYAIIRPERVPTLASDPPEGSAWYLCGSGRVLDALHESLRTAETPVFYERFSD